MKKILIFAILGSLILVTFCSLAMAGNPPGLIVRDDGQAQETPWSGIESIGIPDNGGILSIEQQDLSSSDNIENPINDLLNIVVIVPFSVIIIDIIELPVQNEAN